jgi:hypothetical protein
MTTTINWPTGFRYPSSNGYAYQLPSLNQRTDFVIGARDRELFTDGEDTFTVSVRMSAPQWAYFQGWFRYTLGNGARWFNMPLLAAGTLESREVKIISIPGFQLVGVSHCVVNLTIKTRQGTTMTNDLFEAYASFPDPEAVDESLQALEDFVNL